jgi:hypothetical protein
MMLAIRLAVAVATLAVLSSIPAAGQAPKLSPQQLNSPALGVNKPIAVPKSPTAYSPNLNKPIAVLSAPKPATPNGNKPIAVPRAYSPNGNKLIAATPRGTIEFKRPVPCLNARSTGSPPPDDGFLAGYQGVGASTNQGGWVPPSPPVPERFASSAGC